jgi:hypothetical protein
MHLDPPTFGRRGPFDAPRWPGPEKSLLSRDFLLYLRLGFTIEPRTKDDVPNLHQHGKRS